MELLKSAWVRTDTIKSGQVCGFHSVLDSPPHSWNSEFSGTCTHTCTHTHSHTFMQTNSYSRGVAAGDLGKFHRRVSKSDHVYQMDKGRV